jgi:hypothetical protein
MPFQEQIEKLITKLTELTKEDKVAWQETGNLNTYLAQFGKFIVTLGKAGSELYGGYSFQIIESERQDNRWSSRPIPRARCQFAGLSGLGPPPKSA